MQLAGAVTDLIDLQGSSVILALEDGWDLTAQVSSLAQLCLDPYYRTIQVRTEQVGEWDGMQKVTVKTFGRGGGIILNKATFLDTIYLNSSFYKMFRKLKTFYITMLGRFTSKFVSPVHCTIYNVHSVQLYKSSMGKC